MKNFIDFILVGDLEEDEGDGSDSENSAAVTDSEVFFGFFIFGCLDIYMLKFEALKV